MKILSDGDILLNMHSPTILWVYKENAVENNGMYRITEIAISSDDTYTYSVYDNSEYPVPIEAIYLDDYMIFSGTRFPEQLDKMITKNVDFSKIDVKLKGSLDSRKSLKESLNQMTDENEVEAFQWKYNEGALLGELEEYLKSTYSQHYTKEDEEIQCFDAWIAMGDSWPTFRNTAIKYLWRYGKKNGHNKEDLMKAFHYLVLMTYASEKELKNKS